MGNIFIITCAHHNSAKTVHMHQQVAHPPGPDASSLLDNLSDTLLNAFTRLRKPDERFLQMRDNVEKFEEGLQAMDKLWSRVRSRSQGMLSFSTMNWLEILKERLDLASDYHDLAVATQGLGFLESGITQPLNHVSNTILEFSALLRHLVIEHLLRLNFIYLTT
jgi:sorting nexin-4